MVVRMERKHNYGPTPYMDQGDYNLLDHVKGFMLRDPIDPLQEKYKVCPICALKTTVYDKQCVACHATLYSA